MVAIACKYDLPGNFSSFDANGTSQKTWSLDSLGNNLAAGTYNAANEETPTVGSSGGNKGDTHNRR